MLASYTRGETLRVYDCMLTCIVLAWLVSFVWKEIVPYISGCYIPFSFEVASVDKSIFNNKNVLMHTCKVLILFVLPSGIMTFKILKF
jgi:hypothetical protein